MARCALLNYAIPCCRDLKGTEHQAARAVQLSPSLRLTLDLGNYERFLDITLAKDNNITTGKIYQASTPIGWSGCWHECRCTLDGSDQSRCCHCSR